MLVSGKGKLVGIRHGEKNGKAWGNVYIDDELNLMERLQCFVNGDRLETVKRMAPGTVVEVHGRLYSGGDGGNQTRFYLDSISVVK
ncbi:MAG: hypothetical protein Q4C82_04635 [Eubacteriales bacterium]|nr:hypothetical protein [Eubacteriales bacterium]